jgi:hypothetical protein
LDGAKIDFGHDQYYLILEFPESKENSSVHERLAGAVGNPERVTAGASERRDGGVLLQRSKKERLSRDYENTWSESPEIPIFD